MDFVSLDVETANADMSSICQIGIVRFKNGIAEEEWVSYVDPESYFDPVSTSIHGISQHTVRGAPTYKDVHETLCALLQNNVVVTHTAFDRVAIARACSRCNSPPLTCTWLDSARVARRAWTQFSRVGYGLANVCKELQINFKHHDALEDAKAAGLIIVAAIESTGLDLEKWLHRVTQPIDPSASSGQIARTGNAEGQLFGETVVFTGALQIPRREAADMAARLGCAVAPNVSKKVTMIVVGDQDVTKLAGHDKSSKHRKAEDLILSGHPIRILSESDFRNLMALSN